MKKKKRMSPLGYEDYQRLLATFVQVLLDELGESLISVVLYGSVARGEARELSDLDLLVVWKEAPEIYYERLQPILRAKRRLEGREVYRELCRGDRRPYLSCLVFSQEEARENRTLFLDMIEDSILLFDQGGFFESRLSELRNRLKTLGSKKICLTDGTWYWDLKPDLRLGEAFEL